MIPEAQIREAAALLPDDAWILLPVSALLADDDVRGRPRRNLEPDLTTEEAGRIVGRSASTISEWCRRGILSGAYKFRGRAWRIPPDAVCDLQNGNGPNKSSLTLERCCTGRSDLAEWRRHLDEV